MATAGDSIAADSGLNHKVVTTQACRAYVPRFVQRLYGIMTCDKESCEDSDHKRHHEFLADYGLVCEREHRTKGFGKNYFESDVPNYVCDLLNKELLAITANRREIRTIKNLPACLLKNTLQHPGLAERYIRHVCVKECMVWIRCSLQNSPYEFANTQLSDTEIAETTR